MSIQLPIISSAGQFQSKIKFSNMHRYPENSITNLRTVTDYEIELYPQDGGIAHINGQSYPITRGSLLITKPGDKRQSTLHFSATFIHYNTNEVKLQEVINSISGFHQNIDYEKWMPELDAICRKFLDFDTHNNIYANAKLLVLLYKMKDEFKYSSMNAGSKNASHSVISAAVEYIRLNYTESLTVEEIAKYCCVSTSYLHKLFLDIVHMTPNNYLLAIRLSEAKKLLEATDMPISKIATTCGFNSQAYFSDCFKRHFHISPSKFRSHFTLPC